MGAKVFVSPRAEAQIEAIGDYIAADNPGAAVRFVQTLQRRCYELDQFPERGKPIGHRHRALIEAPYLIVYRIEDDTVTVIAVLHGARLSEIPEDW